MKLESNNTLKVTNIICVVLLVILFICQFTPFWNLEGQSISIGSYIWFPTDHTDLTVYFEQQISSDYTIESMVLSSVLQLVLPVLTLFLFFRNPESKHTGILSICAGIAGICIYLLKPAYRLGLWKVPFGICCLLLVTGILSVLLSRTHPDS